MPRKNKRKFFGNKSNKSKSVKLDEDVSSSSKQKTPNESDSDENNGYQRQQQKEEMQKSSSSVTNDSAIGQQLEADTSITKMGGTMSCAPSPSMPSRTLRWCSEPNLNKATNNSVIIKRNDGGSQKATITLKVIQFIGEIPNETRDINSVVAPLEDIDRVELHTDITKNNEQVEMTTTTTEKILNQEEDIGTMPKLDHFKEEENEPQHELLREEKKRFDDNYRVESPKQISSRVIDERNNQCTKRHAMLIQEISESSSCEEVKQLLEDDNEAYAIELPIMKIESPREYRVDSPESSDESSKRAIEQKAVIVQEIIESSSNESVKNEILDSMSKLLPSKSADDQNITIVSSSNTKIINIKELPSESTDNNNNNNNKPQVPPAKVKLFECKTEKKLNKAEEAIIEALYGNSNLLQIPNRPLDVISEEGSDCSDIERHSASKQKHDKIQNDFDEDDDDVFLTTTVPNDAKYHRQRILQSYKRQRIAEQPKLINTKIIETESNVPESCKSWETKQGDNELQAELVYLPSTSSSATDLSERSANNTDTEDIDEDVSEDTETNSLLENISVPSLSYGDVSAPVKSIQHDDEKHNDKKHEHVIDDVASTTPIQLQRQSSSDYYQEINEYKLPDILEDEEDEEQQQARSILDIIESQQQIENVNKELHHLITQFGTDENTRKSEQRRMRVDKGTKMLCDETILIACDDKKQTNEKQDLNSKSGTPTPTQMRRKYSSDSSTSSSNSQCTIIRQIIPVDNVHPLRDLCIQSINSNSEHEGKITVQKKHNSLSRNAPNIPIINELELHYECDNSTNDLHDHRENVKIKDKVITILQVPPDMNQERESEKERWFGVQSSQMPNLMVALSPLQKDYYMMNNTQDSNGSSTATTSADVLLDMHKKFVERRAYHEEEMCRVLDESISSKNSDTSRIVNISNVNECQFVEPNLSNSSNESALKSECDKISDANLVQKNNNQMDSIRNLILRESTKTSSTLADVDDESGDKNKNDKAKGTKDDFQVKKYELESELRKLDSERKELEEELKNIQSLQHFKREEFLYNQMKLEENESQITQTSNSSNNSNNNDNTNNVGNKYIHDDFNDFINSNERLHREAYNEWQDKVYERNERKLQKMLKITSINEYDNNNRDEVNSEPPLRLRERAASERIVPLNDEFLAKVKERQKRLSLPLDDNLDASTESLLNDGDETDMRIKRKKKIFHFVDNKENFPAHFREFIEYCEQEIVQSKNSVESGESMKKPLYLGLIGVALCICGFYIGKHFLTSSSKFSP